MSFANRLFLDANILFSAALGGPAFDLILHAARAGPLELMTNRACLIEADVNLRRKRPARLDALGYVLESVTVQPDAPRADPAFGWAAALVPPADVHVLAAARLGGANVLLTGDTTHFGALMERTDLGLRVRTPRAFLLELETAEPSAPG